MRLINRRPGRELGFVLAALPFVVVVVVYLFASEARLAANPNDKLLPSLGTMAEAMRAMAFEPDRRTGDLLLWVDTWASLKRILAGVAVAAILALFVGVTMGLLPLAGAALSPFVAVVAMIPPLAVLPILFIALGLGEVSKIALIAIGTAPMLIRDMAFRVAEEVLADGGRSRTEILVSGQEEPLPLMIL